jgi:hypothetical protein
MKRTTLFLLTPLAFGQISQRVYTSCDKEKTACVLLKLIRTGDGFYERPYRCSGGFRNIKTLASGKATANDVSLTHCELSTSGVPVTVTIPSALGEEDKTWGLFFSNNGKSVQLVGPGCDAGNVGRRCVFETK